MSSVGHTYVRRQTAVVLLLVLGSAATAMAQPRPQGATTRPPPIPASGPVVVDPATEKRLGNEFKIAAPGFKTTLFAGPPVAMYPTCVNESPDGAVFVCVDPNLSLSQLKNVGRVMRLVDTDGDGHADKYTTFAEMDSPRGVVSDGKTVYVMHPPNLTAYRDTNGDGIADESVDIVTGLGFDLDFRGADHTTNNIQIGPDGWLYVAVGDYGFIKATGTDGRQIQHRGGAVVRVRPDGSNLEIVAVGTRNIYDVSIDPFAHVYARDNTNDGDGWDTRLHYIPPGANMGYPIRYQNFKTEHFPTMFDYGPGAGVGSVFLTDPTWPAGFNNTLYTGDWTMQKVYRHTLTPKGSTFEVKQEEFISVLRPSDIAVDGNSNMYISSLVGGQFNYGTDTVGYVAQVRSTVGSPARELLVAKATDAELLTALGSGNAMHRLHAQEEILRRGANDATVKAIRATIADAGKNAEVRAMAIFTLKQLLGVKANDDIAKVATTADARVRETALRALADRTDQLQGVSSAIFVKALKDADPQVQIQAMNGLVRMGARDAASSIVPLAGSGDQGMAHLAENALASLDASDATLKGIDGSPAVRDGSLRAIALMHEPATVTALIERVNKPGVSADMRASLLHTLGRLYNREGYWKGDWWTTRPQHLGPYFDPAPWEESPRIKAALSSALIASSGDVFAALVADLVNNQVLPRGASPLLVAVTTSKDPMRAQLIESIVGHTSLDASIVAVAAQVDAKGGALHGAVAELLAGETALSPAGIVLAKNAALDPSLDPKIRGSLLTSIGAGVGQASLEVAVDVLSKITPTIPGAAPAGPGAAAAGDPVEAAWRRFVGDRRRQTELDYFITVAKTGQPSQRALAYAVLLQSIRAQRVPPAVRDKVAPVIDAAFTDASSAPILVQAIIVMRVEAQYTEKLAAYNANKPK